MLKNTNNSHQKSKQAGSKFLYAGLLTIIIGITFTYWGSITEFEYRYVFWGFPVIGLMLTIKGLEHIIYHNK